MQWRRPSQRRTAKRTSSSLMRVIVGLGAIILRRQRGLHVECGRRMSSSAARAMAALGTPVGGLRESDLWGAAKRKNRSGAGLPRRLDDPADVRAETVRRVHGPDDQGGEYDVEYDHWIGLLVEGGRIGWLPLSVSEEPLEAVGSQLGIADRVLDVLGRDRPAAIWCRRRHWRACSRTRDAA